MVDYKIFDRDKFTVVGTPTITEDGVASGFSSSNYLKNNYDINTGKNYIFKIKYIGTRTSLSYGGYILHCRYGSGANTSLRIIQTASNFLNFCYEAQDNISNIEVQNGQEYNIECHTDFSTYVRYYCNGIKVVDKLNPQLTINIAYNQYELGNSVQTTSRPCVGSIDLSQFSIEVDGKEVFSGSHNANIVERLQYLKDSKEIIRQSIEAKGVEVPEETPFRQYADKISDISGGGGVEYTIPVFKTYGTPTVEEGNIYSGFNLNNSYLYDVYTRNDKSCIYRFKLKTSSDTSGEQYILQSSYANLFLVNGKFGAYSPLQRTSYQVYPAVGDTWYYISIKIEPDSSSYATHSIYISTEGFSIEDSDLSFSYREYVSSSDSGRIGCHQNSVGYFKGKIDMQASGQFTLDGAIMRPYIALKIMNN